MQEKFPSLDSTPSPYLQSYDASTTWQKGHSERKEFVEKAIENINAPIDVLDIGCGDGKNTTWIGEQDGNSWTGVDIVSPDKTRLQIPKSGTFIQRSFYEDDYLEHEPLLSKNFGLVVDQGAILAELRDDTEIEKYLARVSRLLKEDGIFVVLTVLGENQDMIGSVTLPDGRVRSEFHEEIFKKEPFSKYFEVISLQPTHYGSKNPANPFSSDPKNMRSISIIQVAFKKR